VFALTEVWRLDVDRHARPDGVALVCLKKDTLAGESRPFLFGARRRHDAARGLPRIRLSRHQLGPFHASRLHSRPEVQARIKEIREGVTGGTVSLEWVQGKIAPMLVADPTQICEPDPENPGRERMRQLRKLPLNLRLAITRIRFDARSGKPVDVYFTDKVAAVCWCAR
jgi:hypothetical protein